MKRMARGEAEQLLHAWIREWRPTGQASCSSPTHQISRGHFCYSDLQSDIPCHSLSSKPPHYTHHPTGSSSATGGAPSQPWAKRQESNPGWQFANKELQLKPGREGGREAAGRFVLPSKAIPSEQWRCLEIPLKPGTHPGFSEGRFCSKEHVENEGETPTLRKKRKSFSFSLCD